MRAGGLAAASRDREERDGNLAPRGKGIGWDGNFAVILLNRQGYFGLVISFFWQLIFIYKDHKQVTDSNVQGCTFRELITALTGHREAMCLEPEHLYTQVPTEGRLNALLACL